MAPHYSGAVAREHAVVLLQAELVTGQPEGGLSGTGPQVIPRPV
jgi:hypothetical protein